MAEIRIGPQQGPQTDALASPADILIFGGSAGGGKTYEILLECIRNVQVAEFNAVIFRRTYAQVTQLGGLWNKSEEIFPLLGARPNQNDLAWYFPGGAAVGFAHLQHEKDKFNYQGAEICLICFDELTHFSETQFFYLVSRNRSMCGVRPYIRCTCNPDADSWVAKFIAWWIDQETGFPIPERAGVLRYMARDGDEIIWGDSRDEVYAAKPSLFDAALAAGSALEDLIKSVTFVPSKLSDNKALMSKDPGYLGNLMSMPLIERQRLLDGNWKVRPAAGNFFKQHWFTIVDDIPAGVTQWVRYWDRAATEEKPGTDPDWTVGCLMGRTAKGLYVIAHAERLRASPHKVEEVIQRCTAQDTTIYEGRYTAVLEQDPGQAGKAEASHYARLLSGFNVRFVPARQNKETRAKPFSAQAEAGMVVIVRGHWNEPFLRNLEAFPTPGVHDDDVDASSGAFNSLNQGGELYFA